MKFDCAKYTTGDEILYVRGCYRQLYSTILEEVRAGDKCIVTGTAGIGISFFGLYSAKQFLKESLTVIHIDKGWALVNLYLPESPSDGVKKVLADRCECPPVGPWAGRFDGSHSELTRESEFLFDDLTSLIGEVVVIVDATEDFSPICWVNPECIMLVVTRPIAKRMDRFQGPMTRTYYLPVWTMEELKDMLEKRKGAPLSMEETQQLAYRVEQFGGNPQIVARSNCTHDQMVSLATRMIREVINRLQIDGLNYILDPLVSTDASKLVHIVPTPSFKFERIQFASEMILQEVLLHFRIKSLGQTSRILKTALYEVVEYASSCQHLNNSWCHAIMQYGGSFGIAPVETKSLRNRPNVWYILDKVCETIIPSTSSRYSFQQNLSDLESLWDLQEGEQGIYVHFPKGSVPFVDSICVVDGETGNKIFGIPNHATKMSECTSSEDSLAGSRTPSTLSDGSLARKRTPSTSSEDNCTRKRTKSSVSTTANTSSPPCAVLLNRMISKDSDCGIDEKGFGEFVKSVKSLCPPGTTVHFCWVTCKSALTKVLKDPPKSEFVTRSQIPQWLITLPDA